MDVPYGRIRTDHLDIEMDKAPVTFNEPQQLKQYIMLTFARKINYGS